jgi:hypothetical protein
MTNHRDPGRSRAIGLATVPGVGPELSGPSCAGPKDRTVIGVVFECHRFHALAPDGRSGDVRRVPAGGRGSPGPYGRCRRVGRIGRDDLTIVDINDVLFRVLSPSRVSEAPDDARRRIGIELFVGGGLGHLDLIAVGDAEPWPSSAGFLGGSGGRRLGKIVEKPEKTRVAKAAGSGRNRPY